MNTIASATLPHHVHAPRYDRQQLQSRIVHFGFGAFHRAHQALLTDRVLNAQGGDWGICEISLFSGDTLFAGSCGRTDFPGGSMQEMAKSLSLLAELPLPDATKVLPGHEGFSTLGQERSTNPYMNGAWY